MEYADNVYIEDVIWESLLFQQYIETISNIIWLTNDILSIEKDMRTFSGKTDMLENLAFLIKERNHLSLEQAKNQMIILHETLEETLYTIKLKLFDLYKNNEILCRFFHHVDFLIGGNLKAHQEMKRYN